MIKPHHLVVSLRDITRDDIIFMGSNAHYSQEGFVVTTNAYFKFMKENNLETKLNHLIGAINFDHEGSLSQVTKHIKDLIEKSKIPDNIVYKIIGHYSDLGEARVTAKRAIISGDENQSKIQNTEKEIYGDAVLLDTVRSLWASLFEPSLMVYRYKNNLDHLKTGINIIIQKN